MESNASNPLVPQPENDLSQGDHIEEVSNKVTLPNPAQDIPFTIPPHIMGHDLNNPEEDLIRAGKRVQKPRLGVKVPSRHLSSQIVTQGEIVQELLERSLKKHPYSDPPEGDILFAMKLTQRLANRIVQPPASGEIKQEDKPALLDEHILPAGYTVNTDKTDIPDHSELLAILEGDKEPDLNTDGENEESAGKNNTGLEQSEVNLQSTNVASRDVNPVIKVGEKHPVIPLPPPKSWVQSRKRGPQYQLIKLHPELEKELALKQLQEVSRSPKSKLNKENSNNIDSKIVSIKRKKHSEYNNNVDRPSSTNEDTLKNSKKKRGRKRKEDLINEEDNNKKHKLLKSKQKHKKPLSKSNSKIQGKIKKFSARNEKLLNKEKILLKTSNKKKIQVKINKTKRTSKVPTNTLVNGSQPIIKRKVGRPKLKESNLIILNETETIKSEKDSTNNNESTPKRTKVQKPSSRTMREINRLLGDEGAINMLYSIEQRRSPGSEPKRKVMLPSYRRKRKDLILKTKLVKNAVLRLSTTPPQKLGKNSLRHRLIEKQENKETPQRKISTDSHDSHHSATHSSPSKFAFPAKIAIPADASRIIRRHSSSSSYSSSSNSPRRMSIDGDRSVFTPPLPVDELSPDTSWEQMQPTSSNKSLVIMEVSERAERLINEKCKELNLQPDRTELLKKRIEYKKSVTTSNFIKKNIEKIKPKIQAALDKKIPISLIEGDTEKGSKKKMVTPEMAERSAALNSCLAETVLHFFNTSGANTSSATPSTSTTVPPIFKKTSPLNLPTSTLSNWSKTTDTEKRREGEEKQRCSPRQNAAVLSFKEISLRRYDHLVQIILTPVSTKLKNALNVQVLRELISALNQLKKDDTCRTVLFTSTGNVFCQGVDFASLIQHTPDKRKCAAVELAAAIKDFVKTLATFAKPIIAGVHGAAVGLGVTMLPLFDMVFASDKATFHTPYAKLGQIPEGAATITLPNMLGNTATSELLFACRKLTASEALHFGLVTRILWPDSFQEELIPLIRGIASQSSQSMDATKALLRKNLCSNLEDTLLSESHLLVQHWSSAECQANFKQFLEEETLSLQKQRENVV